MITDDILGKIGMQSVLSQFQSYINLNSEKNVGYVFIITIPSNIDLRNYNLITYKIGNNISFLCS